MPKEIIILDQPGKYRKDFPEYSISYFRKEFAAGESHSFPPQVPVIGKSPNVTFITKGKLRTYNENRATALDVPARKGQIYGGLLLPGKYTIEALEDSTYVCVSKLTMGNPEVHPNMYDLVPMTLNKNEALEVKWSDGFRAGVCAHGICEVDGTIYSEGAMYLIPENGVAVVIAKVDCELVGYQVKEV